MAMELVCGQCQGRFLAEVPGSVVMCPHCGSHLQTPSAESWPPGSLTETSFSEPVPVPESESARPVIETPAEWTPQPALTSGEPEFLAASVGSAVDETVVNVPDSGQPAGFPLEAFETTREWSPPGPEAGTAAWETLPPDEQRFPDLSIDIAAEEVPPTQAFPPGEHPILDATVPLPAPDFPATQLIEPPDVSQPQPVGVADAAVPGSQPAESQSAESRPAKNPPAQAPPTEPRVSGTAGISPTLFFAVLSVASAMTLTTLYLWWQVRQFGSWNEKLESLPDLAPPKSKSGEVSMIWVPAGEPMNPRHTLRLGESERYGSVKVTPLRVVREPIEFVHFDPSSKFTREPSPPVLKLYLQFENVSADQELAPLDGELVYRRIQDKKQVDLFKANQFVTRTQDKGKLTKQVMAYHLSPGDSWDVKGQNLGTEIKPGATLETFIPTTDEGIANLEGELLWRVHFRKGYNPQSGRGVTTLIEVAFHSDDIEDRTQAPADTPKEPAVPAETPKEPANASKKA